MGIKITLKTGVKTYLFSSFLIKNDEVWEKYNKIWDAIKNKLGIKFHSDTVYEYRYFKAKVGELIV